MPLTPASNEYRAFFVETFFRFRLRSCKIPFPEMPSRSMALLCLECGSTLLHVMAGPWMLAANPKDEATWLLSWCPNRSCNACYSAVGAPYFLKFTSHQSRRDIVVSRPRTERADEARVYTGSKLGGRPFATTMQPDIESESGVFLANIAAQQLRHLPLSMDFSFLITRTEAGLRYILA